MRNAYLILLLVSHANLSWADREACDPLSYLRSVFSSTKQKERDLKNYLIERERYDALERLPASPLENSPESFLAWTEAQRARATGLKVSSGHTEPRDFSSLQKWAKRAKNSSGKYSENQVAERLLEYEMIARGSKLSSSEWLKREKILMARDWVETQYWAEISARGLVSVLGREGLIRDTILSRTQEFLSRTPTRVLSTLGLDLMTIHSPVGPIKYFMLRLPEGNFAKISREDMALLITDGLAAHRERIARSLENEVGVASFYQSARTLLHRAGAAAALYQIEKAVEAAWLANQQAREQEKTRDEEAETHIRQSFDELPTKNP